MLIFFHIKQQIIIIRCVINGLFGEPPIRIQFEMLIIRGFERFDAHAAIFHIVAPVTMRLMDMLLVPHFLARVAGIFAPTYMARSLMVRFAVHAYLAVHIVGWGVVSLQRYLVSLHNEIRDERYLVGTRLTNREQ